MNLHPNKYYLVVLSLCFSYLVSQAQQSQIDSLLTLIKNDKEDTTKINHLSALGWLLKFNDPDTAIILGEQALQLSNSVSIGKGKAWTRFRAASLGKLGAYYFIEDNYPKALDYYLKALKIDEELSDKNGIAIRLGNIGNVYYAIGEHTKALDYYFKALKVREELGSKRLIASTLSNIGVVYYHINDYPKALDYYFKALFMAESMGTKSLIASTFGNIGGVYCELKNYPKALDYHLRALKLDEELGNRNAIAVDLGNIGAIYTGTGKYKEAEAALKKAIALNDSLGATGHLKDAELDLSNLYNTTGQYRLALVYYKKAMILKDSMFSEEKNKELTRKEMNFEFIKKEEVAKAAQDKKDAVTQIIIYSVSAGFFLVLLLAILIFRGFRQKQKANVIISEQKKLVDEKQKDILDSIHYAKRIQTSLLPTEKYINKILSGGKTEGNI